MFKDWHGSVCWEGENSQSLVATRRMQLLAQLWIGRETFAALRALER